MCGEADTLAGVGVDELPNASPQDGANKDVIIASRTIISAGCALPAATQLLEIGH